MRLKDELALFLLDEKQPRRKRLLENLLSGKKTVATLYWALRYQLLGYLGLGRYLGITQLDLDNLENDLLVKQTDNQSYVLTEKGSKLRFKILENKCDYTWKLNFQKINFVHFKHRLLLFIQVVSNYQHHQSRYYPINVSDSEMNFVKYYFKNVDKKDIGKKLKAELIEFLSCFKDIQNANLFASELVGFQNNGKTLFQIASENNDSLIGTYLKDLKVISDLIDFVMKRENSVIRPLLNGLNCDLVSQSALLTYKQYLINNDLNNVVIKRRLKESTINEHLLEVAIYYPVKKFPYDCFIDKDMIIEIKHELGNEIDAWKYEDLSDKVKISFFQFRLIEIYLTKKEMGE